MGVRLYVYIKSKNIAKCAGYVECLHSDPMTSILMETERVGEYTVCDTIGTPSLFIALEGKAILLLSDSIRVAACAVLGIC